MEDRRRSSVYDLTSLRIHPDGLRVHQTDKNLTLIHKHQVHRVKDSRGNWIADNAGGSNDIPVYRKERQSIVSEDDLEDEYIDESEVDRGEESIPEKGKRKMTREHFRANKRKKFLQDDSYLSTTNKTETASPGLPAIPSADLLKNIHKLAADYYDEQGLLINASQRYRKERKRGKLRKLSMPSRTTQEESQTTSSIAEEGEVADDDDLDTTTPSSRVVTRDMYKVLDGSVLMALGVLTQELVKKLINSKVPTHDCEAEDETSESEDVDCEDVEVSEESEDEVSEGEDVESEESSEQFDNSQDKDIETASDVE